MFWVVVFTFDKNVVLWIIMVLLPALLPWKRLGREVGLSDNWQCVTILIKNRLFFLVVLLLILAKIKQSF